MTNMKYVTIIIEVENAYNSSSISIIDRCSSLCTKIYLPNCLYVVVQEQGIDEIVLCIAKAVLNGVRIRRFWILDIETLEITEYDLVTRIPQVKRYMDPILTRDVIKVLITSNDNKHNTLISELIKLSIRKLRIYFKDYIKILEISMPYNYVERKNLVSNLRKKQLDTCIQLHQYIYLNELKKIVEYSSCLDMLLL